MKKIVVYFALTLVFFGLVEFLPRAEDSAYRENLVFPNALAQSVRTGTPRPRVTLIPLATPTPVLRCCSQNGSTCSPSGLCQSPPTTTSSSSSSCSSSSSSSAGSRTSRARAGVNKNKSLSKKGRRSTAYYLRLSERLANRNYYSTLRAVKKKKERCKDGCEVPAGCTRIRGSQGDVEWMQCYRDAGSPLHELCCNTCDIVASCKLSAEDEAEIVERCGALATEQAQINCVYSSVKSGLDEDAVCRHHADCVEDLLGALGFSTDMEVGCTSIFNCHAWVEVIDENGCSVIVDSFNGIMYKCCPEE